MPLAFGQQLDLESRSLLDSPRTVALNRGPFDSGSTPSIGFSERPMSVIGRLEKLVAIEGRPIGEEVHPEASTRARIARRKVLDHARLPP